MKAAYWTAFGAMAMPLGVAIFALAVSLGVSDFSSFWMWLALIFIIAGFASFIAGWTYTIREERQKQKEYELRHKEDELRIRREKASLIVLTFMADALGVDVSEVVEMEEKHLDEK